MDNWLFAIITNIATNACNLLITLSCEKKRYNRRLAKSNMTTIEQFFDLFPLLGNSYNQEIRFELLIKKTKILDCLYDSYKVIGVRSDTLSHLARQSLTYLQAEEIRVILHNTYAALGRI